VWLERRLGRIGANDGHDRFMGGFRPGLHKRSNLCTINSDENVPNGKKPNHGTLAPFIIIRY
jgi:hypothetical protein